MIITENITIDGRSFVRVYSNIGVKIHGSPPEGDYDEAVYPAEFTRTFTETDIPIEEKEEMSKEEAFDEIFGEDGE